MNEYLKERSIEIINNLVDGWCKADAPLQGDISYEEVFKWLDSIGAEKPAGLINYLNMLEQNKK